MSGLLLSAFVHNLIDTKPVGHPFNRLQRCLNIQLNGTLIKLLWFGWMHFSIRSTGVGSQRMSFQLTHEPESWWL